MLREQLVVEVIAAPLPERAELVRDLPDDVLVDELVDLGEHSEAGLLDLLRRPVMVLDPERPRERDVGVRLFAGLLLRVHEVEDVLDVRAELLEEFRAQLLEGVLVEDLEVDAEVDEEAVRVLLVQLVIGDEVLGLVYAGQDRHG